MIIPYLREDLEILRGNSREDGSPAWLLYDALRNKYFTLGLTAFKLIKNWSGGEDIKVFEKKIHPSCKNSKLYVYSGFQTYGKFGKKHSKSLLSRRHQNTKYRP